MDHEAEPESLPSLVRRDVSLHARSLGAVLFSLFVIVLGIARQEIKTLAFGVGFLLLVLGYSLVFVAMAAQRKERERDA